jgi:hypothetical protein
MLTCVPTMDPMKIDSSNAREDLDRVASTNYLQAWKDFGET